MLVDPRLHFDQRRKGIDYSETYKMKGYTQARPPVCLQLLLIGTCQYPVGEPLLHKMPRPRQEHAHTHEEEWSPEDESRESSRRGTRRQDVGQLVAEGSETEAKARKRFRGRQCGPMMTTPRIARAATKHPPPVGHVLRLIVKPIPATHVENVKDALVRQLCKGTFVPTLAQKQGTRSGVKMLAKAVVPLGMPELIDDSVFDLADKFAVRPPGTPPSPNGRLSKDSRRQVCQTRVNLEKGIVVAGP